MNKKQATRKERKAAASGKSVVRTIERKLAGKVKPPRYRANP